MDNTSECLCGGNVLILSCSGAADVGEIAAAAVLLSPAGGQ